MQIQHRSEQLDTSIKIVTPENISFSYQLASISQRLSAYLFDLLVLLGILMFFAFFLLMCVRYLYIPTALAYGIFLATTFLLFWFLGGIFELLWNGQTIGKRAVGIRVLSVDGQPINSFQAIMRNIMRSIDLQPAIFAGIAFAAILCTKRSQRFGDVVCGTMVIVDENSEGRRGLVRFKHPDVFRLAEQLPVNIVLTKHFLKALALYVHRRKSISPRRREYLAAILSVPMIERYNLPQKVHPDLLLCALYHVHFVAKADKDDVPL